jgi:outer membrane lipoprotein-sorting protein
MSPVFKCVALSLACHIFLVAQDGVAILAKIDRFRHPWPSFSVEATILDGASEQKWQVSARDNGDAVVKGISEKEKGRSVFYIGGQMWLVVPGSKHPHKVTPQQKRLIGSVAGGDLANARLSDAYFVGSVATELFEGRECHRLRLEAKKKSEGYKTIDLLVDRADGVPLAAMCYFGSGKLARTVRFGTVTKSGDAKVLTGMSIKDQKGNEIRLIFESWQPNKANPSDFELPTVAKTEKRR